MESHGLKFAVSDTILGCLHAPAAAFWVSTAASPAYDTDSTISPTCASTTVECSATSACTVADAAIDGTECSTPGHTDHYGKAFAEDYREWTHTSRCPAEDEPGDGFATGSGGWHYELCKSGGANGKCMGDANCMIAGTEDPDPFAGRQTDPQSPYASESWSVYAFVDEGVDSGELGKFWGQAAAEAWGNAYGNVGCTDAWSRMMYGSVGSNVWTDW